VPNNAVLVVAGDIDKADTKRMMTKTILDQFQEGPEVTRNLPKEEPITESHDR
jgi:zinc protease